MSDMARRVEIEDALVRETGSASMRTIETVVETYLDALAEGEQ